MRFRWHPTTLYASQWPCLNQVFKISKKHYKKPKSELFPFFSCKFICVAFRKTEKILKTLYKNILQESERRKIVELCLDASWFLIFKFRTTKISPSIEVKKRIRQAFSHFRLIWANTDPLEEKMNTLKLVDFCLIFLLHTARILVAVSMLQAWLWSVFL